MEVNLRIDEVATGEVLATIQTPSTVVADRTSFQSASRTI